MKSTTLYLIRHGETDWNLNKRVQGHQDISLNKTGIQQARFLAKELEGTKFGAVYASPLQRAYHTAKHLSDDIKIDPRLREMCYGIYEGLPWDDFYGQMIEKLQPRESLNLDEKRRFKLHESIESYFEVYTRGKACLDEIVQRHPGEQIAVATHGGLIKSILSMLEEADPRHIEVRNTGYAVIKVEGMHYTPIHYSRIAKTK